MDRRTGEESGLACVWAKGGRNKNWEGRKSSVVEKLAGSGRVRRPAQFLYGLLFTVAGQFSLRPPFAGWLAGRLGLAPTNKLKEYKTLLKHMISSLFLENASTKKQEKLKTLLKPMVS